MSSRRLCWLIGVVVGGGLLVAGCGDDGGDAASTTVTAPPEATSTTVAPTTTTTVVLSDEAAVREVYTRYMTESFARDERVVGRRSRFDLLDELTVDPLNTRAKQSADSREERGIYTVSPGFDVNISEIEIEPGGQRATVYDCSRDRSEDWNEAGELVTPADDFWKWRNGWMVKIDGTWYIEDLAGGGDNRCDPETFADL